MGCGASYSSSATNGSSMISEEALKRNKEIEKELAKAKEVDMKTIKLLLLGAYSVRIVSALGSQSVRVDSDLRLRISARMSLRACVRAYANECVHT
jgi:hypothetical protein